MKLLDRLFTTHQPALNPVHPAPRVQPAQAIAVCPPPLPAPPPSALPVGAAAAALEGIPVFPIPLGVRYFDVKRLLWTATTDLATLEQMAQDNPGCEFAWPWVTGSLLYGWPETSASNSSTP